MDYDNMKAAAPKFQNSSDYHHHHQRQQGGPGNEWDDHVSVVSHQTSGESTSPYAAASAGLSQTSAASSDDAGPAVVPAVAAAPKDESLYESLLRYHEENDDDDDASGGGTGSGSGMGKKKRSQIFYNKDDDYHNDNPRPTEIDNDNDDDDRKLPASSSFDDRKPAAKPTFVLKKPPPTNPESPCTSPSRSVSLETARQNLSLRSKSADLEKVVRMPRKPPPPSRHHSSEAIELIVESPTSIKRPPLSSPTIMSNFGSNIDHHLQDHDLWDSFSNDDHDVQLPIGSFYKAAIEHSRLIDQANHHLNQQPHNYSSDPSASGLLGAGGTQNSMKVPGVVSVNEPVALPDSVMYRRAFGDVRQQRLGRPTNAGPQRRRTSMNDSFMGGAKLESEQTDDALLALSLSAHGRLDMPGSASSTSGGGNGGGNGGGEGSLYPKLYDSRDRIVVPAKKQLLPPPRDTTTMDDGSACNVSEDQKASRFNNTTATDNRRLRHKSPQGTSANGRKLKGSSGGTGGNLSRSNHTGRDRSSDRDRSPKRHSNPSSLSVSRLSPTRQSPTRNDRNNNSPSNRRSPLRQPRATVQALFQGRDGIRKGRSRQSRSQSPTDISVGSNHQRTHTSNPPSRENNSLAGFSRRSPKRKSKSPDRVVMKQIPTLGSSPVGQINQQPHGYNRITPHSMDAIGQEFNSPSSARPIRRPGPSTTPDLSLRLPEVRTNARPVQGPAPVVMRPTQQEPTTRSRTETTGRSLPEQSLERYSETDRDVLLALELSKEELRRNEVRTVDQFDQHRQVFPTHPYGNFDHSATAGTSSLSAAAAKAAAASAAIASTGGGQHGGPTSTYLNNQGEYPRIARPNLDDSNSSSLQDVLLALRLSEECSQQDGAATTNLDALLALEMHRESGVTPQAAFERSVTDYVAAGIATDRSSQTDEQYRILEQIREERERKELELALKVSKEQALDGGSQLHHHHHHHQLGVGGGPGSAMLNQHNNHGDRTQDFLLSQQMAMEKFSNRITGGHPSTRNNRGSGGGGGGGTTDHGWQDTGGLSSQQRSSDSNDRRRELVERGTMETQNAISSGHAHIVTCHGCGGRLQAPITYSLVFCPKCQTISPA